jgi:hypothetical protein
MYNILTLYETMRNNELFYDTDSTIDTDSNIGGLNRILTLTYAARTTYGLGKARLLFFFAAFC